MAALTPGAYLRLRRAAAGLTLREVALVLASVSPGDRMPLPTFAAAERLLADVERDRALLAEPSLRRLQAAVRFDAFVYLALAGEDLPVPSICRGCGCTWADACVDPEHGPCAWANAEETRCTACARTVAA